MSTMLPRILLVEHEASSVGRARALLATGAYEGLVLDLQEGPQALELLGELRQGRFATPRDARVVVLAGGGSPVNAERLQGLDVDRVLGKPVRISELLDAVVGVQEEGAPAA